MSEDICGCEASSWLVSQGASKAIALRIIIIIYSHEVIRKLCIAGNHESQTMNQMYGFEGEVKAKYTAQMSELFTEVYNWLPLAHCLNKKVLVMHGGLFSRDDVTLDEIRKIDRNRQPPEEGNLIVKSSLVI